VFSLEPVAGSVAAQPATANTAITNKQNALIIISLRQKTFLPAANNNRIGKTMAWSARWGESGNRNWQSTLFLHIYHNPASAKV
jgi:hypothetical protein